MAQGSLRPRYRGRTSQPKAGAHFELLGRSVLIESTAAWIDWTDEQLTEEKNALRERLVEASESGKVTWLNGTGMAALHEKPRCLLDVGRYRQNWEPCRLPFH